MSKKEDRKNWIKNEKKIPRIEIEIMSVVQFFL